MSDAALRLQLQGAENDSDTTIQLYHHHDGVDELVEVRRAAKLHDPKEATLRFWVVVDVPNRWLYVGSGSSIVASSVELSVSLRTNQTEQLQGVSRVELGSASEHMMITKSIGSGFPGWLLSSTYRRSSFTTMAHSACSEGARSCA